MRNKFISLFLSSMLVFAISVPANAQANISDENNATKIDQAKSMEFYKKSSELVRKNWNEDYFKTMKLKVGEDYLKVDDNNKKVPLSSEVTVKNQKIMVPANDIVEISGVDTDKKDSFKGKVVSIDELSDKLGYTYEYDKKNKEIKLTSPYQTMRLIVKLKKDKVDLKKYKPTEIIDGPDNVFVLQFDSIEKTKVAYEQIKKDKIADYVEVDHYISGSSTKKKSSTRNASTFNSWGVKYIEADKYANYLQKKNLKNEITVAVVDTGIDKTHPFFKNRIKSGGYDFVNKDSDPSDDNGHGTHVSGIIVDCTPNLPVKILPVKALGSDNKGTALEAGNGIEYAVNHGADIINLSMYLDSHSDYLDGVIKKAIAKNVTVVVAAGNFDKNTNDQCPSDVKEAIVVSSIDSSGKKSSFSNYGSTVDVAAPGEFIYSTYPGGKYEYMDGTSMAAPHITAVCAMYKLNDPSLTPAQVEKLVKKNTKDLGPKGWDKYYGYGVPHLSLVMEKLAMGKIKNVKASSKSYSSVKITWDKVSGASGYRVYRATSKDGKYSLIKTVTSGDTLSYTNTGLATGKNYYYKVRPYRSVDVGKVYGSYSSIVYAKPSLSKPTLKLSAGSKKVYIKWDKISGASGYRIYRSTKKDGKYSKIKTIVGKNINSYTNVKLAKKVTYYYKIRAYRVVNGKKVYSSYSSIKYIKIR